MEVTMRENYAKMADKVNVVNNTNVVEEVIKVYDSTTREDDTKVVDIQSQPARRFQLEIRTRRHYH